LEKGGGGVKAISRTAFAVNYSAPADLVWHVCKVAGLVYKSLRIYTNWAFWDF